MSEEKNIPGENSRKPIPYSKAEGEKIISHQESQPQHQTSDTESQTTNMEVHHHPDLHHRRKKSREYFLEFLMIFLAVTMGFFAEQLREKVVESHREGEYAKSLYDDLVVDSMVIQRTIDEKKWIIEKFDSVLNILSSGDMLKNNEFIYYVERYVTLNDIFTSEDVTFQQLRSSGNFRYMNNVKLYKLISDYYNLYSRYQTLDGSFGTINKNELSELEAKVFNPHDLTRLDNYQGHNFYELALPALEKLEPISTDKQLLRSLYVQIANAKYRNASAVVLLSWLKAKAIDIMKNLKEEYHLK
jgi:hypothetical protein